MSEARLESLQQVSAGLARARTPAEVVDVIVQGTAVAFGAVSSSLCLVDEDGETFELVQALGYKGEIEGWHRFPVAAPLPAGDALRSRRPVVLASIAERDERYPVFRELPTESRSFMTLPLVVDETTALGALTIGFPDERRFSQAELDFFTAVAALCAQALHRAGLLATAEETTEQLRFLADASVQLASSLDVDETIARAADLAVPVVADFCLVALVDDDGTVARAALRHVDPAEAQRLRTVTAEFSSGGSAGATSVLRTGETEWHHRVDDGVLLRAAITPARMELLRSLGFGSAGVMPLSARGRPFGVMVVGNRDGRTFGSRDVVLAEELAARAAVSIENARLFTDRAAVAHTLQASLLPPRPPEVPGMEVATQFRAGAHDVAVGGDFFDVFRLSSNDWGVAIGDVCGKGADAASLAALVRYTLRAAAVHNRRPVDVLAEVNEAVLTEEGVGERYCSAVFGRLELDRCGAWVTLCSGGHPRPIVVRRAGWVDLRGQPGILLGLFPDVLPSLREDVVGLGPGDALVFCTDGITEARSPVGELFGEERLFDVLLDGAACGDDAAALASRVVDAASVWAVSAIADDVAVLVVRVPADALDDPESRLRVATGTPPGSEVPVSGYVPGVPGGSARPHPPREARMALPPSPGAAGAERATAFLASVLHSWRMSELVGGEPEARLAALVADAGAGAGAEVRTVVVRWDGSTLRVELAGRGPRVMFDLPTD
jgi:serine phosphatase RsbU (regulator of sigma subunit)